MGRREKEDSWKRRGFLYHQTTTTYRVRHSLLFPHPTHHTHTHHTFWSLAALEFPASSYSTRATYASSRIGSSDLLGHPACLRQLCTQPWRDVYLILLHAALRLTFTVTVWTLRRNPYRYMCLRTTAYCSWRRRVPDGVVFSRCSPPRGCRGT